MQEKLWIQFNIHSCWKLSTKWIQRYFNIWKANVRSTQLTSHSRLKSCKLPQIPRQRKGCPLIAINQHSVVSPCQSSSRKGKKKEKISEFYGVFLSAFLLVLVCCFLELWFKLRPNIPFSAPSLTAEVVTFSCYSHLCLLLSLNWATVCWSVKKLGEIAWTS